MGTKIYSSNISIKCLFCQRTTLYVNHIITAGSDGVGQPFICDHCVEDAVVLLLSKKWKPNSSRLRVFLNADMHDAAKVPPSANKAITTTDINLVETSKIDSAIQAIEKAAVELVAAKAALTHYRGLEQSAEEPQSASIAAGSSQIDTAKPVEVAEHPMEHSLRVSDTPAQRTILLPDPIIVDGSSHLLGGFAVALAGYKPYEEDTLQSSSGHKLFVRQTPKAGASEWDENNTVPPVHPENLPIEEAPE
jgi:hypothetical protein